MPPFKVVPQLLGASLALTCGQVYAVQPAGADKGAEAPAAIQSKALPEGNDSTATGSKQTIAPDGASQEQDKLKTLVAGLAKSMDKAAKNLKPNGERLEATRALDDARRLARLLVHIVPAQHAALAQRALQAVREGRHSVQNGAPEIAADILSREGRTLEQAAAKLSSGGQIGAPVSQDAIGKGAMNAEGSEMGVLGGFVQKDGKDYAILKVNGAVNLLGLFDIGNTLVLVPKDRLVVGRDWLAVASDAKVNELVASSQYKPQ